MAACLCVVGLGLAPSAHASPDVVGVRIRASFDRSIASATITSALVNETSAIWRGYGVELHWSDDDEPAVLDLEVDLVRHTTPRIGARAASVLGRTALDPSGGVRGPIVVLIDSVESLIEDAPLHGSNVVLREQELGRALGRVLAHELGHVLLGMPTYHDTDGLMRPSFLADDLTRPDRARFQLATSSVARLRARLACLAAETGSGR
jgi:hypothetical protein